MNEREIKDAARNYRVAFPDTFWGNRQAELLDHLRNDNPARFLTWPEVSGTMFVGDADYSAVELTALQSSSEWPVWKAAIQESDTGSPQRLPLFSYTSGNLVHQAYHVMRWQNATGKRLADLKTIVEIGSGYGALPMLARRLGFAGRYLIIDLPIFALLQRYYLSQVGYAAEWLPVGTPITTDLLVGLWSLSEMNDEDRSDALSSITTAGYLVAGCGELGIDAIERAALREPIDHIVPNSYWLL